MTRPSTGTNGDKPSKSKTIVNPPKVMAKQEPIDCYEILDCDDEICELEHLRKLFVGGLAPYTTEESLRSFYEQWGKVVDVVVMRDSVTRRSRGFGFITYTKAVMVDQAQDARPHVIDGKNVEAKRALPRPEREKREPNISVKKLFVGGLKDNHDDECLSEYFSRFGKVISVKILTDKTTGKRRGFAFVEFDDYDAVDKAILQKSHSIKYVMVDVKKSVYSQEQRQNAANKQNNMQAQRQNMQGPPPPGYGPPIAPGMHPYPNVPQMNAPPMNAGPPPPNYNYWNQGPPQQPPPQNYYGGYQQPPHPPMNNWNYPVAPQTAPNWNAGPPQVAGPPQPTGPPQPAGPPQTAGPPQPAGPPQQANWQQAGLWGPPQGPPAAAGPPPNWNAAAPAMPPSGPPAAAGPPTGPPTVAPPANFGTGYQQNYGGGPTKNSNMSSNRMNPYGPGSHYGNHGNPTAHGYGGYNAGPPAGPPGVGPNVAPPMNMGPGPKPVPPVTNGNRRY